MEPSTLQCGSVKVDAATLRYAVEGTGIPTLVIGSAIYYPRTFSRQLGKTCRLAFVDVRHFAETDALFSPEAVTLDTYAEDIDRMRVAVGFEQAVVIGHSHHGNLALEYAKRYPTKVSHLVLIGSPPCDVRCTIEAGERYWAAQASEGRKQALRRNRSAIDADAMASLSPGEAFVRQYVADGPKYWYDSAYDASWLWQGVPVNMNIIRVFRDFFSDYEFGWDPARLEAPVLVVMGRHDYVVPHVLWERVLPNLQRVTYHVFEQSGHTPQVEEPKLFGRILRKWLKKPEASGAF